MIMQGTVDTLFPLEDGFWNYRQIFGAGTPVKLVTFCGGHTLGCNYPGGSSGHPDAAADSTASHYDDLIVNWLDHYVKGDDSVDVGPSFEWEAQTGSYYGAPSIPAPGTTSFKGHTIKGMIEGPGASGGDEAASGHPAAQEEIGASALRKVIMNKHKKSVAILGVPHVHFTGTLTAAKFGYAFFELVDQAPDGTLMTLDEQTMPKRLQAGKFNKWISLHGVTWLLQPGHTLRLEITTGSTQYDTNRTGPYSIQFDKVIAHLPITRKGLSSSAVTSS
jgi:ABC-2 type transport system ATP-binding protein